jgi:hypothetical protein
VLGADSIRRIVRPKQQRAPERKVVVYVASVVWLCDVDAVALRNALQTTPRLT